MKRSSLFISILLVLIGSINCKAQEISGCIDNLACNYNPIAVVDDGSCLFFDACCFCGDDTSTQILDGIVGDEQNSVWLEDNGDGTFNVNFNTDSAIAGYQFQVEGADIISAYGGEGSHFSTYFSDSTGIVVSFSFTGELVTNSSGTLLIMGLDGVPTGLSNVIVSGAGGTNLGFIYDSGIDCVPVDEECFPQEVSLQNLQIKAGWSIFSSYLVTENMDLSVNFSPFINDVIIIKDSQGNAFLPDWEFNAIGDMILGQAYLIKVSELINLSLEGFYFEPENSPIVLNEGWNLLGYLRLDPINLESLFTEPLLSDIIIIKNAEGLAFLPEYDYNGIGDFEPGLGYQIKVDSTQTFFYLEN